MNNDIEEVYILSNLPVKDSEVPKAKADDIKRVEKMILKKIITNNDNKTLDQANNETLNSKEQLKQKNKGEINYIK